MDLDNFRRQWQQGQPSETLDAAALSQLLTRRSTSPVAKMLRNAWLESGFNVLCFLIFGSVLTAPAATQSTLGLARSISAAMLMLCVVAGYYYYHKVQVLRQLRQANGPLRDHVARQLRTLRQLMHLYNLGTLWSIPAVFLIVLGFLGVQLSQKLAGQKLLLSLVITTGIVLVVGGATFLLMRQTMRWYLQRLYGQYLDRLEAALHELGE